MQIAGIYLDLRYAEPTFEKDRSIREGEQRYEGLRRGQGVTRHTAFLTTPLPGVTKNVSFNEATTSAVAELVVTAG